MHKQRVHESAERERGGKEECSEWWDMYIGNNRRAMIKLAVGRTGERERVGLQDPGESGNVRLQESR